MKLTYRLSAFDFFCARLIGVIFMRSLMIFFIVFLIIISYSSFKKVDDNILNIINFISSLIGYLIVLIVIFILFMIILNTIQLLITKGKGVLGYHDLIISDEGLTESTEFNKSLHMWKGIKSINKCFGFYFIRVNEAGGSMHVIRKKHVENGDLISFCNEINNRLKIAKYK